MYDSGLISLKLDKKEICVSMETYRYNVRSRPITGEQGEGQPLVQFHR